SPANPLVGGASSANGLTIALELDGAGLQPTGFGPDYATGITLSLSNTIATFPATANRGARGVYTQVPGSGKWYAEVTVSGTINGNVGVGLVNASWGVTQGTGNLNFTSLLLPSGSTGTGVNFLLGYVSGDTLG